MTVDYFAHNTKKLDTLVCNLADGDQCNMQ